VRVAHKIVTVDTPRERDLYGMLKIELVSGDGTAIYVERSSTMTQYAYGSPIAVAEPGHSGCGVHDWHWGIEGFTIYPIKPGTVVLRVLVDPDPEPEGDGVPTETATITVVCPEHAPDKKLVYKTFIPCAIADPPFIDYVAGDGRGFVAAYNASSRTRQQIMARVRANTDPIHDYIESFDMSHEYASSSVTTTSGPCPYVLNPGATPTASVTATDPPHLLANMVILSDPKPWERIREIGFRVNAAYPLLPGSCPISVEFYVDLKECGGHMWWRTHGNHDDFPAHEVYLDDMPIHTFDPMDNGFFNLCGSGTNYDITTWTLIP